MPRPLTFSVVAPAYNEGDGIAAFHARLRAVMDEMGEPYEVVYVNDGSRDDTLEKLLALQASDPVVSVVNLSRNFGKEIALTAGLDHALGEAVIVIDTDLQDPPEVIPKLAAKWREGNDVVYARRLRRDGETWLKKATAGAFYRLMQRVGPVAIPKDTGDFRLMSRRTVEAVCQLRESHRFMKGLFTWVGFKQTEVTYVRDPRFLGGTKWNYWRLWNLAVEGITSFTLLPLKAASFLGVVTATGAFAYGAFILFRTLLQGVDVPGYASIVVIMLFMGGVQLIALGIIGEYLGRTFNEAKRRPLYFVEDYRRARSIGAQLTTVAREAGSR
jgi:glycosyltransferase involved in cell wall biosynthesis